MRHTHTTTTLIALRIVSTMILNLPNLATCQLVGGVNSRVSHTHHLEGSEDPEDSQLLHHCHSFSVNEWLHHQRYSRLRLNESVCACLEVPQSFHTHQDGDNEVENVPGVLPEDGEVVGPFQQNLD